MKLRFDPKQQFQLDAVASIVDVFEGQPREAPAFSVLDSRVSLAQFESGHRQVEQGVGNQIAFPDRLQEQVKVVQKRNHIESKDKLDAWKLKDPVTGQHREVPHLTVEMETGTGKTYVYLRTMYELSKRYGFHKFVIVVPSVAIREGVLKNLEITRDHFRGIYDNHPCDSFVYDAKHVNKLRDFATSNTMQIMVMNIQAFVKQFGEDDAKKNVIYKESDKLSGRQPIEFVQTARPIVIIDEPQSVDTTSKAKDAIKALNPLCTLRYSATHVDRYNLMYHLDPIRAFELRLVKQIVVASAQAEDAANDAFVKVLSIDHKPNLRAKLRIHKQTKGGPKESTVTVKQGDDLWLKSKERTNYKAGFEVTNIDATPGRKYIEFSNGTTLDEGGEIGGLQPNVWRAQIKHTIKQHLEKERQLKGQGIKVLTLFFIDKVANYREYDEEGKPMPGPFAMAFEEEFAALAKEHRYADLDTCGLPIERLHDGYFAQDKKGIVKDTSGSTQADDDAYTLIMKDKERLLDNDEPLRFIFSHSALAEGWDNPNVFQICTLTQAKSQMKKRQQLGRGLRLPVNHEGERVHDDAINRLYVMATESYEDFARALQTEYEEDCGVIFGRLPLRALAGVEIIVGDATQPMGEIPAFEIMQYLEKEGFLDKESRILDTFKPETEGFTLNLPEPYNEIEAEVIDLMSEHRLQRHVKRESDQRRNPLRKEVLLDPDFVELWNRISKRTTYRVEFDTEDLVARCADAIRQMPAIDRPRIKVEAGTAAPSGAGVTGDRTSLTYEIIDYGKRPVPDILAYIQAETELTRGTIVRILQESGRLADAFNNPQKFLDEASRLIVHQLKNTVVDGIKYEPMMDGEDVVAWEMRELLPEDQEKETIDYLTSLKVSKGPYEYVPYDSEVEKRFAAALDKREDIKLFVKLPRKFTITTPVGEYNPDWAIVKRDERLYLVAETKGTNRLELLKPVEQAKIKCGRAHFESIGVRFEAPVTRDDDLRWE